MFDFPASPTAGQVFSPVGGPTYTWNGVAWAANLPPSATADTRNRIDNPSGQISEELGDTGTGTSGVYFCDQWRYYWNGTSLAVGAFRNSALVSRNGSGTSMSLNPNTPKPSLAAGDYAFFSYQLEGLSVADLQWGTAQAKQVVLRFLARAPAGTYCISIRNAANDRAWLGSFNIPVAAVETEIVMVIPGDTTGTWPKTNALNMTIAFVFACGSSLYGVAGWQGTGMIGLSGMANAVATAVQTTITDVGLYVDPLATGLPPKWEPKDYAADLRNCQRYWQRCTNMFWGAVTSGFGMYTPCAIPVPMRTSPAVGGGVNQLNSSFPATPGSVAYVFSNSFAEIRIANATAANGQFITTFSLNARM